MEYTQLHGKKHKTCLEGSEGPGSDMSFFYLNIHCLQNTDAVKSVLNDRRVFSPIADFKVFGFC